jgi:hypothetical protein
MNTANSVNCRLNRTGAGLALFLMLSAVGLQAQSSTTGALTITVTDSSGAAISGASVTVANGSGVNRTNATGRDGSYTFSLLSPGDYSVKISAAGFSAFEAAGISVHVAETGTFSKSLQVGAQSQQVEVSAQAAAVQSESSSLGGVVGTLAITSLPLTTRNYLQIMNLSPGVGSDVTNASATGFGLQAVYVNGKDQTNTTYQLDGVTTSNYASGGPGTGGFFGSTPVASPDALQEFKVQTSNYDAGYGRNSGANVNVVTKTGSNAIHGTAFEYFRNTDLNANTFFLNRAGAPRGILNENQFGGTVGGPIRKEKLFYFLSYEGTRQKNGIASSSSLTATLPGQLTNDRSLLALENEFCTGNPNNAAGKPGNKFSVTANGGQQLACPGGGAPGQGTVPIPFGAPGGINPVAFNILNAKSPLGGYLIPTPQLVTAAGAGQASFSVPAIFNDDQALLNMDYLLSAKHTIALKYLYDINHQSTPITGAGLAGGNSGLAGNQNLSAHVTSVITPNLVNEARGSFFYNRASLGSTEPVTPASVGLTPPDPSVGLLPVVTITGISNWFGSVFDGTKTPQKYWEWSDQISWSHGHHTIRAGYDQQTVHWDICSCGKIRGALTFQSFGDFLVGESAAQNGSPYSNIFASSAVMQLWGNPNLFREHNGNVFVQDDYKVSQRLTLNMGLRWEYLGTMSDNNPAGGTNGDWGLIKSVPLPPVTGTFVGWTVSQNYNGSLTPLGIPGLIRRDTNLFTNGRAPLHNFAPRIGFAWQPFDTSKIVVRGGGGFFYDLVFGSEWLQTANETPPNAANLTYTGTQNSLATFANPFNPPISPGSWAGFYRTPTSAVTMHGIDPNMPTPLTFGWNMTVQYAITPDLVLEVGYVGNRAEHQLAEVLYDLPQLATASNPLNCNFPGGCVTTNTAANAAQRLPVLGLGIGGVQIAEPSGDANYNAMQMTLRKTFSHGLQFQAGYTWGKCLSDETTGSAGAGAGGAGQLTNSGDPGNRAQQYGPCDYFRPQRLVISYTYQIPGTHSGDKLAQKALNGWSISGVTTAQDGYPLTIIDSRGGAAFGFSSFNGQQAGAARAQMCPGMTYSNVVTSGSVSSRINGYFNPAAFCVTPVVGVVNGVGGATGWGDSGRGIVLGPGQFNFDVSLSKKTVVGGLREDANLEFRAEAFNLMNHAQFGNPNVTANSAAFGTITSTTVGPRVLQFALRYAF